MCSAEVLLPIDMKDKNTIRREYLQRRSELSAEYMQRESEVLLSKAVALEEYKTADILLAYFPVRNEPDILKIVRYTLRNGKRVAFPASDTQSNELIFRYISSLDELLPGAYSIPEPPETNEIYAGEESALCIVPALVYDRKGFRTGYGKGFYDRFLADFKGKSLGLVYSDFLCHELPVNETDIAVDIVITPKEELYIYEKK